MITNAIAELLTDTNAYSEMSKAHNPYGDGQASQRIIKQLLQDIIDNEKS